MKKAFVMSLLVLFSLASCNGDTEAKKKITLTAYQNPIELHTDDQSNFLNDNYQNITFYAQGDKEASKPKSFSLTWDSDFDASSYEILLSEKADMSQTKRYQSTTKNLELKNLKVATTYYYTVTAADITSSVGSFTTEDLAPRNLDIDGVTNVRDFGGWKTKDGKRIRQGYLFRGGRLNQSYADEATRTEPDEVVPQITNDGIKEFHELGIKNEIDFRLDNRNGYPAGIQPYSVVDGVTYHALPMDTTTTASAGNQEQIQNFMHLLCDESNYPLYYHCNIGTDRTGMISYLLGGVLGVEQESLYMDYVFSSFGNIDGARTVDYIADKYVAEINGFEGKDLQEKITSYFASIDIDQSMLDTIKGILVED